MNNNKTAVSSGELMIGNWISYRGEKNCLVASIGYEFATEYPDTANRNGSDDVNEYVGIPLTPEIMEKCGFEKTITKMRILDYEDYRKGNFVLSVIGKGVEVEYGALNIEDRTYIAVFKYLHQLQNLYWCLTGEHLKIEL